MFFYTKMDLGNLAQYLTTYQSLSVDQKQTQKPRWDIVSSAILKEINGVWREKGYGEISQPMWNGMVRGHTVWWLAEVFMDCYSPKGFDSYKAWSIIKTHRIKKEKAPKQKSIWTDRK